MTFKQHIGACAILINPQGQVLLGKRKNGYKAGYYGLPGGHVELGEPVATTIKREVLEETGITALDFEYVGVVRENQGERDFIHFVYVAKNVSAIPILCEPEKCEGWQWINMDQLNEEVLPGHLAAITLWKENKKFIDIPAVG